MGFGPTGEELVDDAWKLHGAMRMHSIGTKPGCSIDPKSDFGYIEIEQYSEIDALGIDRIFLFKIRQKDLKRIVRGLPNDTAHWEMIPIQVKQTNSLKEGEAVGVVLPLPDPLPDRLAAKLTDKMREIIGEHKSKHPAVQQILFVSHILKEGTKEHRLALEGIWRETKKIINIRYGERLLGRHIV